MPELFTYMFLSICMKSTGSFNSFTNASHSYCLLILSYALFKSTNNIPNFFPLFKLC